MATTTRYGLERVGGEVGGSIVDKGGKYTNEDRVTLDRILYALEGHAHSGGAQLLGPSGLPLLALDTTTGSLPSGTTVYYRTSWVDAFGLETAASPEVALALPSQLAAPSSPALSFVATGTLPAGGYVYALTFQDAAGGETQAGPATSITTTAVGSVSLALPMRPATAAKVRVYRQKPGESQLYYLDETTAGTYVDDGSKGCPPGCSPDMAAPFQNTTVSTNSVTITAPNLVAGVLPPGAVSWRLYRTFDPGQYDGTNLVAEVVEETTPGSGVIRTTYRDVGDPALDGMPSEVNQTFAPPPKVPSTNVTRAATSGLVGTTVEAALVELGAAIAARAFLGARVFAGAVQSIPNAAETAIAFNSETYDTGTFHDNATNNTRLVATVAGYYKVAANLAFAANATGTRYATIRKNGNVITTYGPVSNAASTGNTGVGVEDTIYLAAGDYVEILGYQSSGAALNTVFTATGQVTFATIVRE